MQTMAPRSFFAFAALLFISMQHPAISYPPPPGGFLPPLPDGEPSTSTSPAEEETVSTSTHPFPTDPPTEQTPTSTEAPLLTVGFHALLGEDQHLEEGETELERYTEAKKGIFQIGDSYPFKVLTGTFTASQRGVYQFTAIVHFIANSSRANSSSNINDHHVTVSICIQKDCKNNVALQSTAGIASEKFSVLVTGSMALGVGQSVSVFVTNLSGRVLVAKAFSSFMGHIIGAT